MRQAGGVAALFVLSLILYIDRVCIASARGRIASALGLDDTAIGLVFGAFAIGYAIAQVPAGWLVDRVGPRRMLAAVAAAWSVLTALTAAASGLTSLLVVRFLFGMGEAGAFPGAARVFYARLRPEQRGVANGILFSGSRLGAALAFPLLPWMLARWDWRLTFVVLGAVGVVWAGLWFVGYRDGAPAGATALREASAPAAPVLRTRGFYLALAQYFASNFTFFIALSWMLPYLETRFALAPAEAGRYAMIPLLVATTSLWVTGALVDALHKSRLRAWSRRLPAVCGFAIAAGALVLAPAASTPGAVVACFTAAVFGTDMTLSPSWSYCVDLGGQRSGTVSGAMNMFGNVGSFASASAFPLIVGAFGSPAVYFLLAAALNVGGLLCWLGMAPPRSAPAPAILDGRAARTTSTAVPNCESAQR